MSHVTYSPESHCDTDEFPSGHHDLSTVESGPIVNVLEHCTSFTEPDIADCRPRSMIVCS